MDKDRQNSSIDTYLRLLGKDRQTIQNGQGYLDKLFTDIIDKINLGKTKEVDLEIVKIYPLFRDLQELYYRRNDLYFKFLKKFANLPKDNFYGTRLECHISGLLANRNFDYLMPDPPDFEINFLAGKVYIECSSRHLPFLRNTENDGISELKQVINNKSKKAYCNPKTALFIDTTNIEFNFPALFTKDQKNTRYIFDQFIKTKNYGSIIFFTWVLDQKSMNYQNGFNRIDNSNIDILLKSFLDIIWPFGHLYIHDSAFPKVP